MARANDGQVRSVLQAAATNTLRVNGGSWTAGEIDSSVDIRPDPPVAKKLKLSLCKKRNGRVDQ